jgi:4-hydroxybenzoate polyprenyltransferase
MKQLNKIYQLINILSLDVVAGAVICSMFFARVLATEICPAALITLALTVWIIYTIDHLRDAMLIPAPAETDRHRFHQEYFRTILVALVMAMITDFVVVWFVPSTIMRFGIILGVIVLVYLILQRYLKFLKEFFVACLYTMGVLLPSIATLPGHLHPFHFVLVAKFFITALMNLLLFSLFDHTQDRKQQQHSFVTWFGASSTRAGILFLGLFNILSGIWLWSFDWRVTVIFISMNSMLLAILVLQRHFMSNNYYRMFGDAIFFIPLFYLL